MNAAHADARRCSDSGELVQHRADPPVVGSMPDSRGGRLKHGLRERGRPRMLVTSLPVVRADDLARAAHLGRDAHRRVVVLAKVPGTDGPIEIRMQTITLAYGARRWLARCPTPGCGELRRNLHVHAGRLGCRACLAGGLTYASWRFSKVKWLRKEWRTMMDQERRRGTHDRKPPLDVRRGQSLHAAPPSN
jgi:hypothetical protein